MVGISKGDDQNLERIPSQSVLFLPMNQKELVMYLHFMAYELERNQSFDFGSRTGTVLVALAV